MGKLEKILAKNLLLLRQKNNWTQKEVAERTNIARTYISKYESGQSNSPTLSTIEKIAAVFNCTAAELLFESPMNKIKDDSDSCFPFNLSPEQKELLAAYNLASPELKKIFIELIKVCLEK